MTFRYPLKMPFVQLCGASMLSTCFEPPVDLKALSSAVRLGIKTMTLSQLLSPYSTSNSTVARKTKNCLQGDFGQQGHCVVASRTTLLHFFKSACEAEGLGGTSVVNSSDQHIDRIIAKQNRTTKTTIKNATTTYKHNYNPRRVKATEQCRRL